MPSIKLVTEIPGPVSRAFHARRQAAVPRGIYQATSLFVRSAHGAVVEDMDGNQLLDFAGGIGTLNVGHTDAGVVEAVQRQAADLTHMCFSVAGYEGYVTLAERLARLTPGTFAKKTMFVNSGAEAVENAVKIARHATKRPGVLCFEDAFHGRTQLALSLTSKVAYKAGFGPMDGNVTRVPFANPYRSAAGPSGCTRATIAGIEDHFRRHADPAQIAAVIVEPVLGEGGFIVPPPDFLRSLQELCDGYGILFIADEVQTGFGRTGRLFACEHFGVTPDIVVTAKSLGGGLPLAAIVGRAELMDSPAISGLGGTYSGNPVAIAAAHAVIDRFAKGELLARAEAIGARIEARMREWERSSPLVGDVRRLGAMVAIELVKDRATKTPAKEETTEIVRLAAERGVILMPAGTYSNVIRILVPLVVTDAELDEGLAVLGEAIEMQNAKFKMQMMS
jgi:4-aminobutyrate aminotransferase / (S)-3-amino-2-methylpropionate transaminase / 5-aminovalerate transaminase